MVDKVFLLNVSLLALLTVHVCVGSVSLLTFGWGGGGLLVFTLGSEPVCNVFPEGVGKLGEAKH